MGWYEALKDAANIAQKAGNIDLQSKLLDLQQDMQGIQQENFTLREKVVDLQKIIDQRGKIAYNKRRTAVFEVDEQNKKAGPCCTHCWEADGKLISLRETPTKWRVCPHCKNIVEGYDVGDFL